MEHNLDLSLVLIVKNEEKHLKNCLSSFQNIWKDLIIVDTGSIDKTKEIAKSFGAKIFNFKWINDFSAARNFSLEQVKSDWTMVIDADDIITETDKSDLIKEFNDSIPNFDVTYLPYYYHGGRQNPTMTCILPKIWKTNLNLRYIRPIHEYLNTDNQEVSRNSLNIPIVHQKIDLSKESSSERNFRMLNELIEKNPNDGISIFYLAKEYENKNKLSSAIENYLKCIEICEKKIIKDQAIIDCGICQLKQGNVMQAKKQFEKAISNKTQSIEPYLYLSEIEIHHFSPGKAIKLLNLAKNLKPDPYKTLTVNKSLYDGSTINSLLNLAYKKMSF
ncbi:glycosyltransferase [Candidatus Peregrinibacteria bacterium]|nr:glycosyltransferase [Candidatus Peregrinibacteria bacterium]